MQNEQLSYAIVTPYSMRKSRTGGIVARLISRTGLDLVAGRMFAPCPELVRRYAGTIVTETDGRHRATQELIRDYVLKHFTGEPNGQRSRVLFLVFHGRDAVERIRRTVGHIVHERTAGETIRDTFGDYITMNRARSLTLNRLCSRPSIQTQLSAI
jgi:nucleoside diphosphate kinase